MRKSFLVLLFVVAGVSIFGAMSYAIENKSIKSETTLEFYENEYDFLLMPAKLAGQDSTLGEGHKLVEGFTGYRLFTNLSNQAGKDAYQLGGIIPLPNGLGNLGVLLDYTESEGNGPSLDCINCGTVYTYPYPEASGDDVFNWDNLEEDHYWDQISEDESPFDGIAKHIETESDKNNWEASDKRFNLYIGYGLPIAGTPFSAGVSYRYSRIKGDDDYNDLYVFSLDNSEKINMLENDSIMTYEGAAWEYESHDISLEGRYNNAPVDSLLGLSWRISDGKNEYNKGYDWEWKYVNSDISLYSLETGSWREAEAGGSFFPFCGYGNREGDKYSIYTENIYELNPTVAFGLDLRYAWGDYKDKLDSLRTTNLDESGKVGASGLTETYFFHQIETNDLDGDIDNEEFYARTELRLTFSKVRFGLGVAYDDFNEDGDYSGGYRYSFTEGFDDGDSEANDIDDYTGEGSGTKHQEIDYETKSVSWSFPVATEFNISERLVCRLGVEFVLRKWELNYNNTQTENPDHVATYTWKDGYKEYVPEQKDDSAYDDDYQANNTKFKDDDTFSSTIYNLGLGYQVTENLNVDAMWRHTDDHQNGESLKREPASINSLFVGATLAF